MEPEWVLAGIWHSGGVFVVALFMLLVVFVSALVTAHIALPEMRRGNTLFVRDAGKQPSGRAQRVASKLRVPLAWSEPQPGPRHAR